jgi:hypothetical protein
MRAYHLQVVARGGHASWLKLHEREFDKWFEETFGKSRKMPCPIKAEELVDVARMLNDSSSMKLVTRHYYPPLQFYFCFAYANKPPETCRYVLEHLVSRGMETQKERVG